MRQSIKLFSQGKAQLIKQQFSTNNKFCHQIYIVNHNGLKYDKNPLKRANIFLMYNQMFLKRR